MNETTRDCLFFACIALMFAVIGCAAGLAIFDFLAVLSILWAWLVYETEE